MIENIKSNQEWYDSVIYLVKKRGISAEEAFQLIAEYALKQQTGGNKKSCAKSLYL